MLSGIKLSASALALVGALFAAPTMAQSAAHHDHAAHAGHDAKPQVPAQRWATDAPLRAAVLSSCGAFPANLAEGMLAMANGHPLQGVKKMVKK